MCLYECQRGQNPGKVYLEKHKHERALLATEQARKYKVPIGELEESQRATVSWRARNVQEVSQALRSRVEAVSEQIKAFKSHGEPH